MIPFSSFGTNSIVGIPKKIYSQYSMRMLQLRYFRLYPKNIVSIFLFTLPMFRKI